MEIHYLARDPFAQFQEWFQEAQEKADVAFPNAMSLATATKDGIPSVRMVLLKGIQSGSFLFFTNYESQKGKELIENPNASICFFWDKTKKQIRASGKVSRLSVQESEEYFHSRPRGSQIGSWASPQSQMIESRKFLDDQFEEYCKKFQDTDPIPLPSNWGGFRLEPCQIEFWKEQESRLHDRFLYIKENGSWVVKRLAP